VISFREFSFVLLFSYTFLTLFFSHSSCLKWQNGSLRSVHILSCCWQKIQPHFPFSMACHIEWHSRACLYISLRLAMAAKWGLGIKKPVESKWMGKLWGKWRTQIYYFEYKYIIPLSSSAQHMLWSLIYVAIQLLYVVDKIQKIPNEIKPDEEQTPWNPSNSAHIVSFMLWLPCVFLDIYQQSKQGRFRSAHNKQTT